MHYLRMSALACALLLGATVSWAGIPNASRVLSPASCSANWQTAPTVSGLSDFAASHRSQSVHTVQPSSVRQPDLIVVDAEGAPVAEATITGISLSISGQQTQTDANGHGTIPWAIQETQWVTIHKQGYRPTPHISVSQAKPIRITLQRLE